MATATIQVQYEADTTTLKTVINEINLINDVVVKGATDSAKKVKASYTEISKGFSAAFGSQEVSKALGNQTTAIENLGKKGLSLSSSLKGLKQQISELDSAGQAGTDTFNKLVLAAAKLEDQIGDTRARVKILASDTFKFDAAVQAVGALSSVFATAQGAAALFGEKSKDLEKALLKVQAATAIANGVAQIANLIKEESALKTALLTGAQEAYNIAVGKSTGLLKAFRIGLAGTGIGLFVFAIVELISYFQELQAQSANTQTVFDRFKDTFANAKIAIEGYRDSIINAQERIDVALGKTTKLQADVNRQRREDTAKLGKELAPLIVAQEQLRAEYEKELAIVNSPAFKVSSDDRIQALLKSEKIGKELAIVEAEVSRVRTEGRAAINASTKAIVEEEKATRKAKEEKESNNKKVKQTSLEYVKLSETLDEYTKKQRDSIKIETELSDLNLKTAEESFQSRIFFLQAEQAAGDKSLETRINIIKAEGEARKAALELNEDFANRSKIINAETQEAITKEISDETDKRIELAIKYANAVVSAFNAINELNKVNSENRIAEITATSEAELNGINASLDLERDKQRQRLALEKRTAQAIANEKTKQARADKALAIFDIALNTAVAISKAIAASPLTGGLPFSAIVAALGAIQIAAVAAKPLPKFEKGGLIGGKLHSQGGTLIEAEQGEYMVNRRQSAKHRRELDAMNTSTEAFRRMIDEKYVRPALMGYSAGRRGKEGVTVNASLNSKSMEKKLDTINKSLKNRNVIVNINQQDSRYQWQ
jgi:Uncharacterized archaeal coiled-coil protein